MSKENNHTTFRIQVFFLQNLLDLLMWDQFLKEPSCKLLNNQVDKLTSKAFILV